MSVLRMIQKQTIKPVTENIIVSNLTERRKQHIIKLLDEEFDFIVTDKTNYVLEIENILKGDVKLVTDIINKA